MEQLSLDLELDDLETPEEETLGVLQNKKSSRELLEELLERVKKLEDLIYYPPTYNTNSTKSTNLYNSTNPYYKITTYSK